MSCPHCDGTCLCTVWADCNAADYRRHGSPEPYPNDDGTVGDEYLYDGLNGIPADSYRDPY